VSVCSLILGREFAPVFAETNSRRSHTFVVSGTRVNDKTGSGVHFNRHIDSDLRGFIQETSSLQTFNSIAQNCHHKINTYLLLIQFYHFPSLGSNHNSVTGDVNRVVIIAMHDHNCACFLAHLS
jgi:hypothetical protein